MTVYFLLLFYNFLLRLIRHASNGYEGADKSLAL
jgi:hypothetical protein